MRLPRAAVHVNFNIVAFCCAVLVMVLVVEKAAEDINTEAEAAPQDGLHDIHCTPIPATTLQGI